MSKYRGRKGPQDFVVGEVEGRVSHALGELRKLRGAKRNLLKVLDKHDEHPDIEQRVNVTVNNVPFGGDIGATVYFDFNSLVSLVAAELKEVEAEIAGFEEWLEGIELPDDEDEEEIGPCQ